MTALAMAEDRDDPEVAWPPSREQRYLLDVLASLIRRFGTERFLAAPLVRADTKDFPDRWEPTLHALHSLLYRLCWHAHIDPEIAVIDSRPVRDDDARMLRASSIEIAACEAGTATFEVAYIGNDDVAGLLSHQLGQVFLELAPGEPFRTAKGPADERDGSVAAVYLGLGVLAANASMYRRHATQLVGREERSEQYIATEGGLDIADITLLLAVQDILRDEVQGALKTLHGPQREWVEQWKEVLDPHEDELRELLGLDEEIAPMPLSRPAAPRTVAPGTYEENKKFNRGYAISRIRHRAVFAPLLGGLGLGAIAGGALHLVTGTHPELCGAIGVGAGLLVAWWRWGRPYYLCGHGACGRSIPRTASECPGCGGTVAETITQKELEDRWRKAREEEDALDDEIDPSEFAGDPSVR